MTHRPTNSLEKSGLQHSKSIHPAHAPAYAALATASAVYGDLEGARRALAAVDSALATVDSTTATPTATHTASASASATSVAANKAFALSTSPAYSGAGTDSKSHALFMRLRRAEVTREANRIREYLATNPKPNPAFAITPTPSSAAASAAAKPKASDSEVVPKCFRDSKRVLFFERLPPAPQSLDPTSAADASDDEAAPAPTTKPAPASASAKPAPTPAPTKRKPQPKASFAAPSASASASASASSSAEAPAQPQTQSQPHKVLDFASIFGNSRPVRMEICAGSGDWVVARAKAAAAAASAPSASTSTSTSAKSKDKHSKHKDNKPKEKETVSASDACNWVAVEQRVERCYHIWSSAELAGCGQQLLVCCSEGHSLLARSVARGSLAEIFVNYPDPPVWSGSSQRLLTGAFLELCHAALRSDGTGAFTLVTDDAPYALSVVKQFQALPHLYRSAFTKPDGTPQPFSASAPVCVCPFCAAAARSLSYYPRPHHQRVEWEWFYDEQLRMNCIDYHNLRFLIV